MDTHLLVCRYVEFYTSPVAHSGVGSPQRSSVFFLGFRGVTFIRLNACLIPFTFATLSTNLNSRFPLRARSQAPSVNRPALDDLKSGSMIRIFSFFFFPSTY